MAGPEVPQHGALNIGYNYQPVETRLNPPIQLQGTGELWAGVGRTALAAAGQLQSTAQMLQASPVNPAVKAQMQEAQDRAQMGKQDIDFIRQNPNWLHAVVGGGPGGATITAPVTTSSQQQSAWDLIPGGGQQKKPEQKKTEEEKKEPIPLPSKDLNSGLSQAAPAPTDFSGALASTLVPSHGGSTAAATAGGDGQLNTGQPQDPGIEATPAPQPSGSIWKPPMMPLAPPAPGAPPARPPTSQTPAAATQADQANMAKWRTQNEHPVMSSQDALGWMKNFDTGVKRATYLPMGGPGGSPAFAFHMDGGGINTVPVSQIAQKGGGPLIASQNTSQVISSTDQAQQGGPGAQGGPPAAQADQGQPPPQIAQGPPAAPTGPLPVAQAQPQYPNISGPPPAPVPGAYDPVAYRQGIAQAMADPSNLIAQEGPQAGTRSTEGTGTDAHPVPTSAADVAAMNEEAKSPSLLPYWKEDAAHNRYKELPDPQHPFWQQRFYPQTGGFQTGAWGDAENMRKQALFEEYSGTGGVPTGVDAKGNEIILDKDKIDRMSPAEQEAWLAHARDYKNHANALLPTSPDGINLSNGALAVQAAQRIVDKLQYLKDNKIPMSTVSQDELTRSKEAGWAHSKNPFEWGGWTIAAGGGPKNNFADSLGQDYDLFNKYASKVLGGHYTDTKTPQAEEWPGEIPVGTGKLGFSMPKTTDVSTIADLNKIGMTDNWDEAIVHAQTVLKNAKADYQKAAKQIPTANTRLPESDRINMVDLANPQKGYIDDQSNLIARDAKGKLTNGYGPIPISPQWSDGGLLAKWHLLGENGQKTEYNPFAQSGQAAASGSPTPSPTPPPKEVADAAPRPKTRAEFDAIKPGTWFWDGDGLKPHP